MFQSPWQVLVLGGDVGTGIKIEKAVRFPPGGLLL
jgi:hypothetical protein